MYLEKMKLQISNFTACVQSPGYGPDISGYSFGLTQRETVVGLSLSGII